MTAEVPEFLNREAFEAAFTEILLLAHEVGLARLAMVSIDGGAASGQVEPLCGSI